MGASRLSVRLLLVVLLTCLIVWPSDSSFSTPIFAAFDVPPARLTDRNSLPSTVAASDEGPARLTVVPSGPGLERHHCPGAWPPGGMGLLPTPPLSEGIEGWQLWLQGGSHLQGENRVRVVEDATYDRVVELSRTEGGADGGAAGIYQPLDIDVASLENLHIWLVGRVLHEQGGNLANTNPHWFPEGAVQVRIKYQAASGTQVEWYHGFYAQPIPDADAGHFTHVPPGRWFSYVSPDLLALPDPPQRITELRAYGFGWEFRGQVAGADLLTSVARQALVGESLLPVYPRLDSIGGWRLWLQSGSRVAGRNEVSVVDDPACGRALEFERRQGDGDGGAAGIFQLLDEDVRAYEQLRVRLAFRILREKGNNLANTNPKWFPEGAVQMRLKYLTARGEEAEWYHGFYSEPIAGADGVHFDRAARGTWMSYVSDDLMRLPDPPVRLLELRVYGFGWEFHSRVAEVEVYGLR